MNARVLRAVCAVCAVCAVTGGARERPDFWAKGGGTLLLSRARQPGGDPGPDEADPPAGRDRVLDMPGFLPLCGNGRVDTRADYAAYYADPRHLPLNLTRAQLLPGHLGLADADAARNLSLLADEECDDGNRLDLDGCSADCMHLDLWTSACEVAVDGPRLVYEDLFYDPVRGVMVASALDGVYSLSADPGDLAVRATLLAAKSWPATNLARQGGGLTLYSAGAQCLWHLPDGASALTLLRNLSGALSGWTARAHFGANDSVLVHDGGRAVFLAAPQAAPVMCDSPALHACVLIAAEGGLSLFHCDNLTARVRLAVAPGMCHIEPQASVPPFPGRGLLIDALEMATRRAGVMRTVRYRMEARVEPAERDVMAFIYALYYSPWGLLIETPIISARKLASDGLSPHQVHYLGDPSLARMLTNRQDTCGAAHCGFDARLDYDLLAANPLHGTGGLTWQDVLQAEVTQEAARPPALANLSTLRADQARYDRVIAGFADTFAWSTGPRAALALEPHPGTRSLWIVRADRLVVVPKSGVQLQRADGKCLPESAGLCAPCEWAPAGHPCRPCAERAPSSWAWAAKIWNLTSALFIPLFAGF